MNEKLRIGIIGYRGFGAFCTEAFHQTQRAQVVAYAGRNPEAMAETARFYGVPHTFTDWHELVADPDVQLVHIVTPPDKHAEMAIAALNAGKHVLIEKPLATSNEDAQAILDALQQHPECVASINYVMRYNALYTGVADIRRSGCLGDLTHVSFQNYASDGSLGNDHWFWNPEAAGGIFIEHGVHFFDIIGSIIGAPAADVIGQTWIRQDEVAKEDRVLATVTYENGVTATYFHAFNRPSALEKQLIHFAFERGHIILEGWNPFKFTLDALVEGDALETLKAAFPQGEFTATPTEHPVAQGNGKEYPVTQSVHGAGDLGDQGTLYLNAVSHVLDDIIDAIEAKDSSKMRVSAADGATSLAVAVAARDDAERRHANHA